MLLKLPVTCITNRLSHFPWTIVSVLLCPYPIVACVVLCYSRGNHCAGKRKGCHPHPPKPLPETQLYVLWVFYCKYRTLKGYFVALSYLFHLKFSLYSWLGSLTNIDNFKSLSYSVAEVVHLSPSVLVKKMRVACLI